MKLLVLEGPAARPNFEITEPLTLIGRAPECDVLVFDAQVSRHHAQILHQEGEFHIQTLQQTNPVIVNDRFVTGGQRLRDGDLIIIGGVVFEVDLPPITRTDASPVESDAPPIEDRRTPRPPALPPPPPHDVLRALAARLAAAGQRIQARMTSHAGPVAAGGAATPTLDAILAMHERLGGDAELARLAGLLSERLSNQTDIRALYRLSAEATNLIAWSRTAQRSIAEAGRLAEALGAH